VSSLSGGRLGGLLVQRSVSTGNHLGIKVGQDPIPAFRAHFTLTGLIREQIGDGGRKSLGGLLGDEG
jgi:hypothetical protein